MRTSIFENDETLSGGNSRNVVIELRGYTPQYSIYYTAESRLIKDELNRMGWSVSLVVETSGGILGYGQRTWKIYANVLNQYPDSVIPSYVRSNLSDVMTVNDVRVLNESADPSNPNGWASSDNPSGNDPLTWTMQQVEAAKAAAEQAAMPTLYIIGGVVLFAILLARR